MSLLDDIYQAAPWLFTGPLPQATDPLPAFEHQGQAFVYAGGLEDARGGQFEALLDFLAAHEGNPLAAGPGLLAVLYKPTDAEQTPEWVKEATAAFQDLPMSIAYPALMAFLSRSAPRVA